jgi:hypothetical protein
MVTRLLHLNRPVMAEQSRQLQGAPWPQQIMLRQQTLIARPSRVMAARGCTMMATPPQCCPATHLEASKASTGPTRVGVCATMSAHWGWGHDLTGRHGEW